MTSNVTLDIRQSLPMQCDDPEGRKACCDGATRPLRRAADPPPATAPPGGASTLRLGTSVALGPAVPVRSRLLAHARNDVTICGDLREGTRRRDALATSTTSASPAALQASPGHSAMRHGLHNDYDGTAKLQTRHC